MIKIKCSLGTTFFDEELPLTEKAIREKYLDEFLIKTFMEEGYSLLESVEKIENDEGYSIYKGVFTELELGYYVIENGLFTCGLTQESLSLVENYLDYEKIGHDYRLDTRGFFTEQGFFCIYA